MTQSELKELTNLGAELGAAKAENDRLREALRWYEEKVTECRKIGSLGDNARQALDRDGGFRARDALSQQTEPTDAFTAVDMATAAAQAFRDGQAAVEPAPAQDEREAFEECWAVRNADDEGNIGNKPLRSLVDQQRYRGDAVNGSWVWFQRGAAWQRTRPAQTEQQPCEAEEWRSVDGYEGLYSVSSLGRLRSDRTGKYLSLNSRVASGYVKADMHKDGEKKQTTVHRLVAQAFLERPEGADEVNHINGDKLDNRVSNLAWCSRRENVNHGYYELGHLVHRVKAIPIEGNGPELVFASIEQAVANGFHSGGIYTCLGQPHRYHLGYYWRSLKDAAPIAQTAQGAGDASA